MKELFSESAKKVLTLAQQQAKDFRHQSVGTEHLLLALVQEKDGLAGSILRKANAKKKILLTKWSI